MSENTKICPYCGEEIQVTAKKCKHCGEWLVIQEKDKPKAPLHIGAWIEGLIALILIIIAFNVPYNDMYAAILLVIYIGMHIYLLPSLIADKKRTKYTLPIFLLNLFLGATGIVWLGCLIWAICLTNKNSNREPLTEEEVEPQEKSINKPNESCTNNEQDIPNEIKIWNWGAFWANWLWGIPNKSYQTFWVFVPFFGFIWMIVCGLKGNEWAWKNKKWSSIEEFEKSQYKWALVTNIIATITILISVILCLAFFNISKETIEHETEVLEAKNPVEQCKDALGKTNLSNEDVIICEKDMGINVYGKTETPNTSSGYAIDDEEVKTHEFMGINIDYNPKHSTEQEVENAAVECFNNGKTTKEELYQCVGIRLRWF